MYLSGVGEGASRYWDDERLAGQGIALEIYPSTDTIGESTRHAFAAAENRLVRVTERHDG
ncbi:hypothetical protein DEU38_107113 [Rhodococcus sp. AG1013]|uniref:hypothetical protein n=1 Tax=Rhodococcus sp. AG1013 TaxID=2183996 RepID=UPI000E2DBEA7|nr:hypothetical protein [Rhodococcus sp. AG1013]RDI28141.1 hypothetical protein DEU38_107113 [Rhodococcus sp. AG1013]